MYDKYHIWDITIQEKSAVPLNKPSDFFEQKENEENLSDEKTKVETQKRILSPSGLLDEKEEVVVEENIEENIEEE